MNAPQNGGGLPRGELLGRYRTYEDAQKVVGHLAAAEGFDVKKLTIVGNDLRSVERIRSRLTYPKVAGAGAAQGAMFGVFIGLLMMLFTPEAPLMNLVFAVVLGMAVWMIIGVVGFSVRRGRREFASTQQLAATTYDVVCDFAVAVRARQLVTDAGVQSLNRWNDPTGRSREAPQPVQASGNRPQAQTGVQSDVGSTGSQPEVGRPDGERSGERPTAVGDQSPAGWQPDTEQQSTSQLDVPQPTGSQHSAEGAGAEHTDAEHTEAGEGPTSSSTGYESLPDGRPRYGVRLSDLQKSSGSEQQEPNELQAEEPAAQQPEEDGER